jgi:hypothetical protein
MGVDCSVRPRCRIGNCLSYTWLEQSHFSARLSFHCRYTFNREHSRLDNACISGPEVLGGMRALRGKLVCYP